MSIPDVLVIGPGGSKGFLVLGFLVPLEEKGILKQINHFCGVSIGAIISLLLISGYNIKEIISIASNFSLELFNFNFSEIIANLGFMKHTLIKNKLSELLIHRFDKILTLEELYEYTGKTLYVSALNLNTTEAEILSRYTHPNLSCLEAILASINIPLLFYKFMIDNNYYIDGGLGNPYPVDYFDDGEKKILAIYMENKKLNEPVDIYQYIVKIIDAIITSKRNDLIKNSSSNCKHIKLISPIHNDFLGVSLNIKHKADMIVEGFNQGKKYIEENLT